MGACPKQVAMEVERSGWICKVFWRRKNCLEGSKSCMRKLIHIVSVPPAPQLSFQDEPSLKSVCWIMRFGAITEKTTGFEVRRVRVEEKVAAGAARGGSPLWPWAFLTVWI